MVVAALWVVGAVLLGGGGGGGGGRRRTLFCSTCIRVTG